VWGGSGAEDGHQLQGGRYSSTSYRVAGTAVPVTGWQVQQCQLQGGRYSSAPDRNCTDGIPKCNVTHLTSREYMFYIYGSRLASKQSITCYRENCNFAPPMLSLVTNNKEAEKILKYKDLTIEIQRMWNVKTKVIPVIIGSTGAISKSFRK